MTDERHAPKVEGLAHTAVTLQEGRLTRDQIDLLKRTIAKGASDDEFALFIETCNHTGLNPFVRQIYCIKRRTKNQDTGAWEDAMVTQVAIDGFRLVAERTGKYRGQTVPMFADAAGNWREVWLDPTKPPVACKVGVLKEGFVEPLYATAHYAEYVQKTRDGQPNAMWRKFAIMLAKCAEALALRKAFPQELSGLYSPEELPPDAEDEPPMPRLVSSTKSGDDMSATVDAAGHVELTFGEHKGKKLVEVPIEYLRKNFIEPWADAERRATAVERVGEGFVSAVYAEVSRRNEELARGLKDHPDKATALARWTALVAKPNRTDAEDLELDELSSTWEFKKDEPVAE